MLQLIQPPLQSERLRGTLQANRLDELDMKPVTAVYEPSSDTFVATNLMNFTARYSCKQEYPVPSVILLSNDCLGVVEVNITMVGW